MKRKEVVSKCFLLTAGFKIKEGDPAMAGRGKNTEPEKPLLIPVSDTIYLDGEKKWILLNLRS